MDQALETSKSKQKFRIIFLGAPASGKGTQARLLAETFALPHISTGQIFRDTVKDVNNPLSAEIGKLLAAGQLVSDEIINAIVEKRLAEADCANGFVLEGYPRSMKQVEFLKATTCLDYVFLIDVPDEIIIERVVGRRSCPQGHPWHVKYLPPKVEGICDICEGVLTQRSDDTEETAKTRLNVYHQEVDGVIEFYKAQGSLIIVNGNQHVEEVYRDLVKAIVSDLIK